MNNNVCDTTKCYTFYSYKGGSGRTTTAVNTAKHLADKMLSENNGEIKPILLIDADLESAGLTYFFNCDKKFTSIFNYSIHTNKIINDYESFNRSQINGRRVFGNANEVKKPVFEDLVECFSDFLKTQTSDSETIKNTLESAFKGITLTALKRDMLKKIATAVTLHYERRLSELDDTTRKLYTDICKIYSATDLCSLINLLSSINKKSADDDEKSLEKQELVENFLPAVEFEDVSDFFGFEKGVVKFLGVDVKYDGEQVVRNDTADIIAKFIDACSTENYYAIIFDSGAGVQSSAHALHSTSDVLVYCMRPTFQFLRGTVQQLSRYQSQLMSIVSEKENNEDNKKRSVIVLPTAVPDATIGNNDVFCSETFEKINAQIGGFDRFADRSFCTKESCLHEVALFKWNECILGSSAVAKMARTGKKEIKELIGTYSDYNTMPDDAKKAYTVYKSLADKLVENT